MEIPSVCLFGGLGGRKRANGKGMNVILHHAAKRVVDHTLSQHSAAALETGRNDKYTIVSAAFARTGVARVQRAVVVDLEGMNVELCGQNFPDTGNGFSAHGRVFRKGRTVVRTKTP